MRRSGPPAVRRTRWALAAIAYLPLLWTSPGRVSADTKTYLTLDPARLLAKAPWLWDSATGLGTVSHQTIGYLFPLGPWYWLGDRLGLPDWITQRLWLGTVFFAAGAGVLALARSLRLPWRAAAVAAVAYQLSPYLLPYAARLSVILLPWAGLGWLMTFLSRALDDTSSRWRWPAAFALVVLIVGGVNATALVLAGLGPLCLLVWRVGWDRTVPAGRALGVVVRTAGLCLGVSAWWIAGLWAQGRYGLPILRYTETYEAVARAATPAEILRGLGYWFGYGRDAVSPWVDPVGAYAHNPALVLVSLAVPALGLTALARSRWRSRALPVLLVVVGTIVSVGAHPYDTPSVVGRAMRSLIGSGAGQALRSTPRAVPLVALGLALGLGVGVEALAWRRPRLRWAAPAAVIGLLALNLPSLWSGQLLTSSIERPEELPSSWPDAAALLDARDPATRVLEVPGSDFAYYRWGGTVDPVLAGLTDRDVAARELVPWGSPGSADLLAALDRRWQDRIPEPTAVAPLLRRLGVGDVVLRNDLQYERFRLARPRTMAAALADTPGLGSPVPVGQPTPNRPVDRLPLLDAEALTTAAGTPDPAPLTLYRVDDPRPVVRVEPARTTLVAGDGEGLVDVAATGALDVPGVVLYAGDLTTRPQAFDAALAGGAEVVVTDTNRQQARRWGSVREYLGATEVAGERPLRADPTDNRLDLFPGAPTGSFTTATLDGVSRVQATSYGNPITYTPEDRAVMALDGDPRTAWRTAAFAEARGERLEVEMSAPVTTDHLTLLQPLDGPRNRWITAVRLRFDGRDPVDVALDDRSRQEPGQRIDLGPRRFTTLSIEVTDTNYTRLPGYAGISAVGFAEVGIEGQRATEVIRLPSDVLARVTDQALSLVLTRWRASALDVNRSDPEPALARSFSLPVVRTFDVAGTGALSPRASDATLAAVLAPTGVRATATARLGGDTTGTALATIDDDPTTVWRTPIDAPGQTLHVELPAAVTLERMRLQVVADGRHSVPTQLRIAAGAGEPVLVNLPALADGSAEGSLATMAVVLPRPLTATSFDITITAVREVRSIDADSGTSVVQPVGIAELGVPGLTATLVADDPGTCRDDLVRVDDRPLAVRLRRTAGRVVVEGCGTLTIGAGDHRLTTVAGRDSGIDLDRLVLRSPSPGVSTVAVSVPEVAVTRTGRASYRVVVSKAKAPFWLVLGQSHNAGWHAAVNGTGDLGGPTLVDGFANGWLVQPRSADFTIELRWTPQRVVWGGLAVSALAALACLALVLVGRGRALVPAATGAAWRRSDAEAPDDAASMDGSAIGAGSVVEAAPVGLPGRFAGSVRSVGAGRIAAVVLALACSGWRASVVVVLVLVAARVLPGRLARPVVLAPGLLLAAVALYVVTKQIRYDLPTDLDWPRASEAVQPLAWAAVFLVVPAHRSSRRRPPSRRPASGNDGSNVRHPAAVAADAPHRRSWPPGVRSPDGAPSDG